MADRFHGTLYVSNSEMHGDTDWVRASDYDAAQARIRELEAHIFEQDAYRFERDQMIERQENRIRELETQVAALHVDAQLDIKAALNAIKDAYISKLETVVTKFLDWNGTDYAYDEAREYALVGICEEAYTLIPHSQSDRKVEHD